MGAAAKGPKSRYALHTEGQGMAQTIQVRGTPHVIEVDAVPAFGGKDAAPGPLAYALASLTSCSQATAQIVAKELGIAIERMQFDLEAEIDMSVLIGLQAGGLPDFQPITVHVTVAAPGATDAQLEELRSRVERRCPMFQVFTRAGVPIRSDWSRA
jgi:putative redox protein